MPECALPQTAVYPQQTMGSQPHKEIAMKKRPVIENRLNFVKMQGLGNDYIYVEEFGVPLRNAAALARKVSDRHFLFHQHL